jgi:Rho termination factor, N-terminal domain
MRLLARILLAAGAIGVLIAGLRKLFDHRPELLRASVAPSGPQETQRRADPPTPPDAADTGNGTTELSREELYEKAQGLKIEGRSKMNKRELARAVAEREAGR